MSTTKRAADISDTLQRDFRLAMLWSEAYLQGLSQPREKLDAKFFPFEVDKKRAEQQIAKIKSGELSWIDRDKADLTIQKAPHLFTTEVIENEEFEIPEQLKDVFTLKDLTTMEEEDFDDLIDQIDAEQEKTKRRKDVISSNELQELEQSLG